MMTLLSQMDPEFQTKLKMLPRWVFWWVTVVARSAVECRTELLNVYREGEQRQPRKDSKSAEKISRNC